LKRNIHAISLVLYILSFIALYASLFLLFRTFLHVWYVSVMILCVLIPVLAITIATTADYSYKKRNIETITVPKVEAAQEPQTEICTDDIVEEPIVSIPQEKPDVPESNHTSTNTQPKYEEIFITKEPEIITLEKEDKFDEYTQEIDNIFSNLKKEQNNIKEQPVKPSGEQAMDELRRKAKEKRSKEDIIKQWKVINPFGTQKQCARELNLSLKTVKKWW